MQVCPELLDQTLEDRPRISRVVDGEVWVVTQTLRLTPKNHHAGRVKSLEPNAVGTLAQHVLHALAHLASCLISKGDREDLRRPNLFMLQEVSDATSEHRSLARTSTSDNEQRLPTVFNRFDLLWVKTLENVAHKPLV